jgi:hypothetical protein
MLTPQTLLAFALTPGAGPDRQGCPPARHGQSQVNRRFDGQAADTVGREALLLRLPTYPFASYVTFALYGRRMIVVDPGFVVD